jgi:tetratricopeptide (TPR) repeat protein
MSNILESQPKTSLSPSAAFAKATECWRQGDYGQTIALCRKIIAAVPRHKDSLGLLGLSLFQAGDHTQALKALNSALSIAERADFLTHRAMVLRALKRDNDAFNDLIAATKLKPDYAEAHASLGRLLRQSGNRGGALKHLKRAAELNWQQPRVHSDLAAIYLARDEVELAYRHFEAHFIQALPQIKLNSLPKAKSDEQAEASDKPKISKPELFGAALPAMKKLLDAAGIEFFLGDGTALGCVRDSDFISFDKDIDIGVWDSVPREKITALLEESDNFWIEEKRDPRYADILICGRYRDVVAIDIFFYKRERDYVWHGLRHADHEIRWRQTPFDLVPVEFRKTSYLLPSPVERYLTELYEDWRKPDPDYCPYVTGNIVGGLPLMAKCYALKDMQSALGAGKAGKALNIAKRLLPRLKAHAPSSELEAGLATFIANNG